MEPTQHEWNRAPGGIYDPTKATDVDARLAMIAGMHPIEHNRQTGRTTRMMLAAANHVSAGAKADVLFKDEMSAKRWRDRFGHIPNLTIRGMHRSELHSIDWKDWAETRLINGVETFVDHDVLFIMHKEIFKAYAQYDLPLTAATKAA